MPVSVTARFAPQLRVLGCVFASMAVVAGLLIKPKQVAGGLSIDPVRKVDE